MDIWERTKIGQKYKTVIPKTLREHLGLREGYKVLWLSFEKNKKFNSKYPAYTIDIVVLPKE
ncbi:MAG TPA: AbrB/MazE/SpoVT family DNA-binding domain-containing protein [Thermoplasmatales archaeon]|nr:AbrB/MazE/SpoVT family DNA-binding domain-containing protein [Thermoplasmatales archaeon]